MAILAPKIPRYTSRRTLPATGVPFSSLATATLEGQAYSNLGRVVEAWGDKIKRQRDAAVVGDIYNSWRDQDRAKLSELLQRKGRNAVNLGQDYNEFFDKSFANADKQAENGSQQASLRDYLSRRREQSLDILSRYEAQEAHRYRKEEEQGFINNAISDARESGFNEQRLYETIQSTFDHIEKSNIGIAPEAMAAIKRKVKQEILFANMQSRISTDPDLALKDIEAMRSELGEGYQTLVDAAHAKSKERAIDNAQAELQTKYEAGGTPDFAGMRKELTNDKSMPKDVKFEVRTWIDAYEASYNAKKTSIDKQAHDNEEKQIGVLYSNDQYVEALGLVRRSQNLSGDEIREWTNAIKTKQKEGPKIDPTKNAADIIRINGMISRGVDPNRIRAEVLLSPYMGKEDKEQYLNKLETKLAGDLDVARRTGYDLIKSLIIPKRGALSTVIETPLEVERVKQAQMAFDDWMNFYVGRDTPPTKRDAELKAKELGESMRPTIAEQVEYLREQAELQKKMLETVK